MNPNFVIASRLNRLFIDHIRTDNEEQVESLVDSIASRHIERLVLDEPPVNDELGRRISVALASNPHIRDIRLVPNPLHGHRVRHVIEWFTAGGETLARITNLEKIVLRGFGQDTSVEDWDWMFRLLLTSKSLRSFEFDTSYSLSEAAFASLCDGIANSRFLKFTLGNDVVDEAYLATGAESLALAISRSCLKEVRIENQKCAYLLCMEHFTNLDVAFSQIENDLFLWRPNLKADIPLGLWPHILSRGPQDMLLYLLKEKVDSLLPHT